MRRPSNALKLDFNAHLQCHSTDSNVFCSNFVVSMVLVTVKVKLQTGIDITVMDSKSLCQLLLFGSTNLTVVENRIVLEATMVYMKATKRFN